MSSLAQFVVHIKCSVNSGFDYNKNGSQGVCANGTGQVKKDHLSTKYFLCAYCVPSTVPGAAQAAVEAPEPACTPSASESGLCISS